MRSSNLFLVGPMGAGKTTIGRQLSQLLRKEFKDSDHELVARTGASIPLIFEIEGEGGFRKRECEVIDSLTQESNLVLATGGGAILMEDNRRALRERGTVVYLYATIDQILRRTAKDKNRPLLQTADPRAKLEELMKTRDPLYREVAHVIIYTDDRSVRSVVKEVLWRLDELRKSSS